MSTLVDFCFKGQRDYVQGPDIVLAVLHLFKNKEVSTLDIKFNGVTKQGLKVAESYIEDANVNVRCMLDGESVDIQLIESGAPITCRKDFDEDEILKGCTFNKEQQAVIMHSYSPYSFIENMVSLNKYLLNSIFSTQLGKWYFTRLELSKVIENNSLLTVKFVKNFNFRLLKSDVYSGGELVASIYFTLIKES